MKVVIALLCLFTFLQCGRRRGTQVDRNATPGASISELVDSVYAARSEKKQTSILFRRLPKLSRDSAYLIQSMLFDREFADTGSKQIGWKLGGTNAPDSIRYNPMYAYMTARNSIERDSVLSIGDFVGQVMVEAEVGFKISKDLPNGARNLDELKYSIDYAFGAVEIVSPTSVPPGVDPPSGPTLHAIASNLAHQGIILGDRHEQPENFEPRGESVKCYINDQLLAEGDAKNIYGSPLGALLWLSNALPEHNKYLRKGDIVITGSLYQNPVLQGTGRVRIEFSSLGEINFDYTTE